MLAVCFLFSGKVVLCVFLRELEENRLGSPRLMLEKQHFTVEDTFFLCSFQNI